MQKGLRRWFCEDQRQYDPLKHDADATKEEMQQTDALLLHADHREEWWLPMYLALAMGVRMARLGSICDCCLAARLGDGRFTAWAVRMLGFVIAAIKVARVTPSWNEAMCMQEAVICCPALPTSKTEFVWLPWFADVRQAPLALFQLAPKAVVVAEQTTLGLVPGHVSHA